MNIYTMSGTGMYLRAGHSPQNPPMMQKTLVNSVNCSGIGVHSGNTVQLQILPATSNYGIWFERTDLTQPNRIQAIWSSVSATELCTQISNAENISVSTIEHLMAALAALEIDNVHIKIDGPEVPVMDGSSEPFVSLLLKAGIQEQAQPRRILHILKDIEVKGSAGQCVSLKPSHKFIIDYQMDFQGRHGMNAQTYRFTGAMARMREDIGRARTFGFLEDVEKMRAAGFAKGGSLENAVVIDQGQPLNSDGFRYPDECVRHKVLDAIGDLYLIGGPLRGHYQAHNGGHSLNNQLLRALMANKSAWTWAESHEKSPAIWQPIASNLFEPLPRFG